MQKRKFDELISYFNRKVSEMNIGTSYKMELLGMVTALGYAHEKETEERKTGRWIYSAQGYTCSECKTQFPSEVHYLNPEYTLPKYCPECGARLEDETNG